MTVIPGKRMSVEEYLEFEITSELRHEYLNGQLLEIAGEQDINNTITLFLTVYFFPVLSKRGYSIYYQSIKVSIPDENRFYYPDWFITAEPSIKETRYIKYQPELIAEVLSKTSRIRDTVDKYIDYTKIPSLKYYLIIDPETPYVTVHSRNEKGEWEADAYSSKQETIPLPLLDIELPMSIIYK